MKDNNAFSRNYADKNRDTWLTPREIISALGPFQTDPCCPPTMPWATASTMLTEVEDGLKTPWHGRVWMNPPYSHCEPWMRKLAHHGNGIALIPMHSETRWFQKWVFPWATALFIPSGRIKFCQDTGTSIGPKGAPKFTAVYCIYGENNLESFYSIPGYLQKLDGISTLGFEFYQEEGRKTHPQAKRSFDLKKSG